MWRAMLCSALLVSALAAALRAGEPPKEAKRDAAVAAKEAAPAKHPQLVRAVLPPAKRMAYRVRNLPARDLAETVKEFLHTEATARQDFSAGLVIVPEPITNSLLMSVREDQLDQLAEMIRELDANPGMVAIEVLMAEVAVEGGVEKAAFETAIKSKSLDAVIAELKKRGQVRLLARPAVTTLNNQPAFIQIGQRVPRITGTSAGPRGNVNTVTLENVGLTLGITPRISADGVVTMEIDVEESHFGPAEEGTPISTSSEGEVVRMPEIRTSQLQTTVCVASGEVLALGGLLTTRQDESPSCRQLLLYLTAEVLPGRRSD